MKFLEPTEPEASSTKTTSALDDVEQTCLPAVASSMDVACTVNVASSPAVPDTHVAPSSVNADTSEQRSSLTSTLPPSVHVGGLGAVGALVGDCVGAGVILHCKQCGSAVRSEHSNPGWQPHWNVPACAESAEPRSAT